MTSIEITKKVSELMAVLENDIRNLEDNLTRLTELRTYIVKRDNASLQKMLERIQSESNNYKENESKRKLLRGEIAELMGCRFEQMTLTKLETELSGEQKIEAADKKLKLKALAEQLKREHLSTAVLLNDCARYNSLLLKSILEMGHARTITYSPKGYTERQSNSAFMNMQF
ncbi:MAG: hypothetical protein A2Y10_16120 [Planctomycetes bacterium GWF2_41_51]|nr:MAG: hypothetical protein A2Y10_16120 [Planctomycetes bacterium GWF2_41_51]HBG26603.1 hypothetical protein [Phycisphaerales bacterium]